MYININIYSNNVLCTVLLSRPFVPNAWGQNYEDKKFGNWFCFLCGLLCLDILFQQNFDNTKHMTKVDINFTRIVFTTDETKPLVKSVCKPAPKSLFWAPTYWSTRHDWAVKKSYCSIGQSGWREIGNSLPVICWVRRGSEQGSRRCFADVTNWR